MQINIDALRKDASLLIARSKAIEEYGKVEQALSRLFAFLLGTSPDVSGIVFFRISGSWQRNQIIELLLEKKFATKYSAYWDGLPGQPGVPKSTGLMALLRKLDEVRNQIVHWTTVITVELNAETGQHSQIEALIPPNIWGFKGEHQMLTATELNEFSAKADFVSRSITMFALFHSDDLPEESKQPLLDIFQQPCSYPPSESHPLARRAD